jgi:YjbE family integral membrane protein
MSGSSQIPRHGQADKERRLNASIYYVSSIFEIIIINLALSGDNAVVIAMAARKLPARQRRTVIIGGGILAVLMQLAFVLLIARLMLVPGLPILGALLLIGIACKLLQDGDEIPEGSRLESATRATILRIALANLVMSFDNVLAVAGTCRSDPIRMAFGLVVSIAIIFAFSTLIIDLMGRFPWITYVGASLLAVTAAGMTWPGLGAALRWTEPSLASVHLGRVLSLGLRCTFTGFVVFTCLSSPWWWPAAS